MKCSPDMGHQPVHVRDKWYRCPKCGKWFVDYGPGIIPVRNGPVWSHAA